MKNWKAREKVQGRVRVRVRLLLSHQSTSHTSDANLYIYIFAREVIIITGCIFPILLGICSPGGDHIPGKEYGCNLQDTFRLIGRAITMTS